MELIVWVVAEVEEEVMFLVNSGAQAVGALDKRSVAVGARDCPWRRSFAPGAHRAS
jgi:hypothetical protein